MFVGHLAVALAAKRWRPSPSAGWYIAAATTLDLIWPVLLLAGVEQVTIRPGAMAFTPLVFDSYPWSHSLVMACVYGLLLALLARRMGVEAGAFWVIAALVVSHWVLDFVTHAPDMPLWPGASPRFGLGLWNSIPATYVVEGALWVAGVLLYLRGRRARSWVGALAFWSLVLISTVMWAFGPYGSPPPDARSLGWFALIGWIVVPWAWIADRHYVTSPSA